MRCETRPHTPTSTEPQLFFFCFLGEAFFLGLFATAAAAGAARFFGGIFDALCSVTH